MKVLKEIVASTSKDKGAEKLSVLYDKTNNADNAKDPLNYYGYAQGEFASKIGDTTTTTLRAGILKFVRQDTASGFDNKDSGSYI